MLKTKGGLDSQIDSYMSETKAGLDQAMDDYMAESTKTTAEDTIAEDMAED